MTFSVYIPARYGATRLPGKPLLEVNDKTIIEYVYNNAMSSGAQAVVIATDDDRIADIAHGFGADVVMTRADHLSGTDRIAEAVEKRHEDPRQIIVNVQADEPMLPPEVIRQVAEVFADYPHTDISTVCELIDSNAEFSDPNIVKVARCADDRALYFSRAGIPFLRDQQHDEPDHRSTIRRHIGIYGYRADYLRRFVDYPSAAIENIERLEQLRALYRGDVIICKDAISSCGLGVDTAEDYERLLVQLKNE